MERLSYGAAPYFGDESIANSSREASRTPVWVIVVIVSLLGTASNICAYTHLLWVEPTMAPSVLHTARAGFLLERSYIDVSSSRQAGFLPVSHEGQYMDMGLVI